MPSVTIDTKIAASAEKIWDILRQSQDARKWNFFITNGGAEGGGQGHSVVIPGGGVIDQRLEHVSDKERLYIYSLSSSSLPIKDCVAKCRVIDNGDGTSTLEWSSNFTPQGLDENEATRAFKSIFESGFQNFKKMFPV